MVAIGFGCNSPENQSQTEPQTMEEPELDSEPGFDVFLAQFKTLALPLVIGGDDFDNKIVFPDSPHLERESEQSRELYGAVEDPESRIVPLGRIFNEDKFVFLLLLESGVDYHYIDLLAYTGEGKRLNKIRISQCYLSGDNDVIQIFDSHCLIKTSEFISLGADTEEEMVDYEETEYFLIGEDGSLETVDECE